MPTKQSSTKNYDNLPIKSKHRYYSELARLTTGLFIGVIALMTFLLTVGFSHPDKPFEYALYSSIVILPLGLLAYVIGQALHQMLWMKSIDATIKKKDSKIEGKLKALRVTRAIQQILFVLALVAVTGLALSTAHFFFAAQTQQQTQAVAPE